MTSRRTIRHAQVIATGLGMALGMTGLVAQRAPSPPRNLRVLSGGARPATNLVEGNPPTAGKHPYFDYLASRPEVYRTFSLRDQEQLATYAQSPRRALAVTYDPANDTDPRRQDAAKVVIPSDRNSLPNQVRLPIEVSDGSILITWDAWFGKEFQFANHGISTYKTFQFASPDAIWCEVRNRFREASGGAIAQVDVRTYKGGSRDWSETTGPNVSRDTPLAPQLAEFTIQPETWTRYWALFERGVDPDWDLFSLWVADERREPVRLFDRRQLKYRRDVLGEFWLEYNTSSNGSRETGPLVSYVRNVVMLRNVRDPVSLLQKPTD